VRLGRRVRLLQAYDEYIVGYTGWVRLLVAGRVRRGSVRYRRFWDTAAPCLEWMMGVGPND
jgi:hypothetical protein